jgi:hypothetical protein
VLSLGLRSGTRLRKELLSRSGCPEPDDARVPILRSTKEFRELAAPPAVGPHYQPQRCFRIEQSLSDRLPIPAVQALTYYDSACRAAKCPREDTCERIVEPGDGRAASPDDIPDTRIVSVDHPSGLPCHCQRVLLKVGPWRPPWPPVQRVQLGAMRTEFARQPVRKRGLTGAAGSDDHDASKIHRRTAFISRSLPTSANRFHVNPLTSASAFSSQYVIPISRYIVVAVARCS